MNRLAFIVLVLAVVCAAEEEQLVNDRKLQGLLLPLAAKAVAIKAVAAKAAVAGAVVAHVAANAPQVSVQEAPCQQVCKDKCTTSYEKSCKMVPVTKQECATVPKTVTQKQCSKNCQITVGHGRKMKGLLLPLAAKAVAAKVVVGAVATKAAVAAQVAGAIAAAKPDVNCQVECVDVPVTVNEVQCQDVTTDVEQCVDVPKQTCDKECVCIPMKQITVSMGAKP